MVSDHVFNHELVVCTLKKELILYLLPIGLAFLVSCIDIICFGLHVVILYIPSDDDNYYAIY